MSTKEWKTPTVTPLSYQGDGHEKICAFPFPFGIPSCKPIIIMRVPEICNPAWPQAQVCRLRRVPQRTIRCTHKSRTLS